MAWSDGSSHRYPAEEFEPRQGWARLGSNQRPAGYEPAALPLSYGPPYCSKRITFNYTFHLTHKTRPTPEEEQDDCKVTFMSP